MKLTLVDDHLLLDKPPFSAVHKEKVCSDTSKQSILQTDRSGAQNRYRSDHTRIGVKDVFSPAPKKNGAATK